MDNNSLQRCLSNYPLLCNQTLSIKFFILMIKHMNFLLKNSIFKIVRSYLPSQQIIPIFSGHSSITEQRKRIQHPSVVHFMVFPFFRIFDFHNCLKKTYMFNGIHEVRGKISPILQGILVLS